MWRFQGPTVMSEAERADHQLTVPRSITPHKISLELRALTPINVEPLVRVPARPRAAHTLLFKMHSYRTAVQAACMH